MRIPRHDCWVYTNNRRASSGGVVTVSGVRGEDAEAAMSETYIEPMCGREVPKPDAVNRCACEPCGYLADAGRPGRCEREGYESGYCLACIHGCFE